MNHERIVDLLSDYRDGALADGEREAVALHLSACADCASRQADLERLTKALFGRPPAPTVFATEAFAARVMARLPVSAAPVWFAPRWMLPAFGAGFAVFALSFQAYPRVGTADAAAAVLLGSDLSDGVASSSNVDLLGLTGEDR